MRKLRKKLKRPRRPYDKERIERELQLLKKYGLRRKREIWNVEEILRKFRRRARRIAAEKDEEKKKILMEKLVKMGLLDKKSTLDDVLSLTVEDILDRRLQTIVLKKGLANTPKQARQFITHGHVAVGSRRVVYPGFLIPKNMEKDVKLFKTLNPSKKSQSNEKGEPNTKTDKEKGKTKEV